MKKLIFTLLMAVFFVSITATAQTAEKCKLENCPMKGTADCPLVKNCPLKGTPDCPLVKNCPLKGTADCPLNKTASADNAETVPACCKSKKASSTLK